MKGKKILALLTAAALVLQGAGSWLGPEIQVRAEGTDAYETVLELEDGGKAAGNVDAGLDASNGDVRENPGILKKAEKRSEVTLVVEAEDATLENPADFEEDADAASHGGKHIRTRAVGAKITVSFTGTGIRFYTKKGSGAGVVSVEIDGQDCGDVDQYVAGSPAFQAKVFERENLGETNEAHTLVLTTTNKNPHNIANPWFNFDYFEIIQKDESQEGEEILSPGDTTYYLDSTATANGDGLSEETPFNALSEINRRRFAPGDRILIKRNSRFTGQLYPKGSGSAAKPIILDVYGEGEKPLIDGAGRYGGEQPYGANGPFGEAVSAVYLHNSAYWEINSLKVTNWDQSSTNRERSGIRIEASGGGVFQHIYIKDCDIYDVRGFRGQDSIWDVVPTGGGTAFYGSRTTHRTGGINLCTYTNRENNASDKTRPGAVQDGEPTIFDDILIAGNTIDNCDANGITTTNVKGELDDRAYRHTNVIIRNNRIHNVQRAGIVPLYTDGVLVEHNKVDTFQQTMEGYGCGIWCDRANDMVFQYNEVCNGKNTKDGMAFNLDDMTENGLIQYNYTHNNVGGGIMLHVRTNSYNRNNTIRYNLSVNDTHNYAAHQAIIVCVGEDANTKIESAKVYNNTFFNTRTVRPVYEGDEIEFKNNIFYLVNKGMKDKTDAYETGAKTTFQNNLFAGVHPKDEPSDTSNLSVASPGFAGMLVTKTESQYLPKNEAEALRSAKLTQQSTALQAGLVIENNGGTDLFGNPVDAVQAPHMGAYNGTPAEQFEQEDFSDIGGTQGEPSEFEDLETVFVEGEDEQVIKTVEFRNNLSGAHGGKHISSDEEGAAVGFTFTGKAISVYTKTGAAAGVAEIYLDDQKVAVDDQFEATERFHKLAYTKTFSTSGRHTVKVVRSGNSNPSSNGTTLNFDCFKVFQERPEVVAEGTLSKLDPSGFRAFADSVQENEGPAGNAVDGNESTYWHSNYSGSADVQPDFERDSRNGFIIDLGASYDIQKLEYLPRRDMLNGTILKYKLFYSETENGAFLPVPRGIGIWAEDNTLKAAVFEKVNARRLQIKVYQSVQNSSEKDLISAAEFSVYEVKEDIEETLVTIGVRAEAGGRAAGTATVVKGSKVMITATPDPGYDFAGWYVGGERVSESSSYEVTATADEVYTAKFTKAPVPEKVTITVNAEAGGKAAGTATVEKGSKVWIRAAADAGFAFAGWYAKGTKVSGNAVMEVQVDEAITYTAKFVKNPVITAPDKVVEVSASAQKTTSIKIKWRKDAGAAGYEISRLDGKSWKVVKSINASGWTDKGLKAGTAYRYRIRAYRMNGTQKLYGDYSATVKTATAPKKTSLKVLQTGRNKVKLTWKKGTRADKFDIYVKTGKGKYKWVNTRPAKATGIVIGGLKKGRAYQFRIKPYKKSAKNKIYGKVTTSKRIKIK